MFGSGQLCLAGPLQKSALQRAEGTGSDPRGSPNALKLTCRARWFLHRATMIRSAGGEALDLPAQQNFLWITFTLNRIASLSNKNWTNYEKPDWPLVECIPQQRPNNLFCIHSSIPASQQCLEFCKCGGEIKALSHNVTESENKFQDLYLVPN